MKQETLWLRIELKANRKSIFLPAEENENSISQETVQDTVKEIL